MIRSGRLALVLHAHLPYVRHPEHARHLEEHWLFEAITDCHLPLLALLRAARGRGSRFRLTLSLSPTLLSMLADPLLRARYLDYLGRRIRLCERELVRHSHDRALSSLARHNLTRLLELGALYTDDLDGDLIRGWGGLCDAGMVGLITTAATHGYLPLLRTEPAAVRAQLRVGYDAFTQLTGRAPAGLWLPECGYYPGLEREIARTGFRFTVLDAHGIEQGNPRPARGVYAPLMADDIAVFGRDPHSSQEIWSRERGYPGNPWYREYYSDLGFNAASGVLGDFLPAGVDMAPTGIKYHRVTGGAGPKSLYVPDAARRQAARDAARFIANRRRLLARLADGASQPPVVVAAYDAELFGHWWYEGPVFLDALIRQLDEQDDLQAVTLTDYLAAHGTVGCCRPAASSWGEGGYNAAWMRPETGWVHLRLAQAAAELGELIRTLGSGGGGELTQRLLCQSARTLLLAQSSDWTFHMGRDGGGEYSARRLRGLLARFDFLTFSVRAGVDPGHRLAALEQMDNLFPRLTLAHFI